MADARDLLVELGTEELPSSELQDLGAGFARTLADQLAANGLEHGAVDWFATPRRLAVRVASLAARQPDETVEHRGPPVSAAFDDDGRPTKAAEGFAGRHGVGVGELVRRVAGKAEYLFHVEHRTGRHTAELLPALADRAARDIPARKRMRWGIPGVTFPRPVHWTVLLFGNEHLEAEILGVRTGPATRGHRFHHPAAIELERPDHYEQRLFDPGHVIAGFDARAERIRSQVVAAAREAGGEADLDPELLGEVTALVEWPLALAGRFDRRFLDVPPEALVAVMKDHQKYFPVHDRHGALLPAFVTVSNIDSAEPQTVRAGNERVIEPRLADAEFFWQQDRQRPLGDRLAGLADMVFQRRLGTLHDRAQRIAATAAALAPALGAEAEAAREAGRLAKCDLLTEMVGEFPELQGLMGGYYARHEGYPEPVARAIADHYRPAFAGDTLPRTPEGSALALADRLDVLVGIFAIGQGPTGDRDPFALRRAALGALRIVIEGGLELDLEHALAEAAAQYDAALDVPAAVPAVLDFMMDRLRVYYTGQGFGADLFDAVLARRPTRPADFDARMRALRAFRERPEAHSLVEANKRIRNILRKAEQAGGELDRSLLAEGPEAELGDAVEGLADSVARALDRRDYQASLAALAELAGPLDRFFDAVMVMADDERLRGNRIALLDRARALFLDIADLSRLQTD
jgi:glycyl-tRNA synthetase beta chain